eukprot:scaffold41496_cov26-Tisochrysis_lutea.AAC.1
MGEVTSAGGASGLPLAKRKVDPERERKVGLGTGNQERDLEGSREGVDARPDAWGKWARVVGVQRGCQHSRVRSEAIISCVVTTAGNELSTDRRGAVHNRPQVWQMTACAVDVARTTRGAHHRTAGLNVLTAPVLSGTASSQPTA